MRTITIPIRQLYYNRNNYGSTMNLQLIDEERNLV